VARCEIERHLTRYFSYSKDRLRKKAKLRESRLEQNADQSETEYYERFEEIDGEDFSEVQ
jgi:hypothetical protein